MIREDYIMKMISMFVRALMEVLKLKKEEPKDALDVLENTFRQMGFQPILIIEYSLACTLPILFLLGYKKHNRFNNTLSVVP